ncbi:uncharacterized protein LOC127833740 isoform X2 [Dreissena polymorpha]|uniref:uncharacterized protein LOC127833740 isoform X2 n=1 Tax=Dreissena polymorpha TaxID=45954 RepID=UPI002265059C|nr:uncharacterized protein LOC127833740 isoform X2 [Dreissena polymorpha]XP_052215129.1 uncharacterized protein LOC127833740 isoform X2 [Dreissena polymorpha]
MSRVCLWLALTSTLVCGSQGQWPLGPDFYRSMNQLQSNLNRMSVRLATMGELAEQRRQVKINTEMARAQEGVPFGELGRVFLTSDGGLGYAYNSTDGSTTMYALCPGSPPHGYMFHSGPFGTSYRSW